MTVALHWGEIDKEKLRDIIFKNPEFVQQGLNVIDTQLGTEEEGIIEFLAVDKGGRLVLINFDTHENDNLLVSSLSQMQWLTKIENVLKRLYVKENVNFDQFPLLLIIAPFFSEKAKAAAKQITSHDIKFIEYKYMLVEGRDAVAFDEVFSNKSRSAAKPLEIVPPRPLPLKEIRLTPEEIAGLLNFEK